MTAEALDETTRASARQALAGLPERIVFFDGVCSFCDGAVTWLRDHDPDGRLHFASLQGETADRFRRAFPSEFPAAIDTLVYVKGPSASRGTLRISQRAEAVIALCEELGGGYSRARWLRALPAFLVDAAYRLFAANRYRVFGRLDACAIPTHDERARLLP